MRHLVCHGHKRVVRQTNPWAWPERFRNPVFVGLVSSTSLEKFMFKVKRCGESVLTTGFGTLEMPPALLASFRCMVEEFPLIEAANKADFSFASETDGFLPFGSEYAKLEGHPDLCERFCYWSIHADRRQSHPFSKSRFVQAASAYEAEIHSLAQGVVDAICEEFGASPLESIRSSSYMQLCVYGSCDPQQQGTQVCAGST